MFVPHSLDLSSYVNQASSNAHVKHSDPYLIPPDPDHNSGGGGNIWRDGTAGESDCMDGDGSPVVMGGYPLTADLPGRGEGEQSQVLQLIQKVLL